MWFEWIEKIAKSIRPTESWAKFKIYYKRLLDPIYARHCTNENKNVNPCFCEKYTFSIKDRLQNFDVTALKKHCQLKEPGCRSYCEKYCDHFSSVPCSSQGCSISIGGVGNFNCPANASENLLPIQQDIDDVLTKSLAGKSCFE